jgi:alpha-D-ribose 1-methylphosphonate 5-triphosphate synthase subunit PhnL
VTNGASAIFVRALSKRFEGGSRGRVLDDVEMTVRGGTLTLIRGAPGSGKSTLVRCLTGTYRADAGQVTYILGHRGSVNLTAADPRTVAWLRNHHIASLDGLLAAAPRLPASVAVARAARREPSAGVAALARLGVQDLASVPVGRLRAADRLTVALTATLLAERPFVVLDEPELATDANDLANWLTAATQAGAAIAVTGAPDSSLGAIATATGELRKGRVEWVKQ